MNIVVCGDSLEKLKDFADNTFDSCITDPPYEMGFMGRNWDATGVAYSVEMWKEVFRVLKPGGHLLAFGGTRTYHRMACAVEDAGFEIRDCLQWLYGSGWPKGMDISKTIDKAARGVPQGGPDPTSPNHGKYKTQATEGRRYEGDSGRGYGAGPGQFMKTKGVKNERELVAEAKPWEGWSTSLKPAHEPIVLARKPLSEKTVAGNVLKWGTGGLNIDGCRIPTDEVIMNHSRSAEAARSKGKYGDSKTQETHQTLGQMLGRFPANVLLDEQAAVLLDEQSGESKSVTRKPTGKPLFATDDENRAVKWNQNSVMDTTERGFNDSGGASRFFYVAKASKKERTMGGKVTNNHPTVKPIKLIEYLITLITPPGGIVLDPFAGSGTTALAAINLGFNYVLIEKEEEYVSLINERINNHTGRRKT